MSKKLFCASVSVDFEMAVYAEDEAAALKIAREHALEEFRNLSDGFDVSITSMPVPKELDETFAYGANGCRTVAELREDGRT